MPVGKDYFFDSAKVMREVKAETRKALIPLGAEIRKKAQRSMRPARRLRKSEVTKQIAVEQLGLDPDNWKDQLKTRRGKLPYKASVDGEAPRTRRSKRIRRLTFFRWDPATESVVVGPERFGSGDALRNLEHGGTGTIKISRPVQASHYRSTRKQRKGLAKARAAGKIRKRTGRRRPTKRITIRRTIRIKAKPFMRPQLDAIRPKIPRRFKNLVR